MSYLIVGGSHQQQKQKINKICRTLGINFFPNQPDCLILRPQKSIGIEQVRQVKNFLNKKSWQGGAQKIVVVWQADLLTIEAQNAFLKTLEEPPPNSLIFLAAANQAAFLPTILSRCRLINLPPNANRTALASDFSQLTAPLKQRLKIAESIAKNRDRASVWLENLTFVLQGQLTQTGNINFAKLNRWLNLVSQARQMLVANVSPRCVLDWLMLKL